MWQGQRDASSPSDLQGWVSSMPKRMRNSISTSFVVSNSNRGALIELRRTRRRINIGIEDR